MSYTPDTSATLHLPGGEALVFRNYHIVFTVFASWEHCYKGCYVGRRRYYVVEVNREDHTEMSITIRCSGCDYGYDLVYNSFRGRQEGEIPEKVMKELRRRKLSAVAAEETYEESIERVLADAPPVTLDHLIGLVAAIESAPDDD
jgi:hypothetical protein